MITHKETMGALPAAPEKENFLTRFMQYGMACTDAPSAFHLFTAMSTLSSVIPANFYVTAWGGKMRANLFTMLVGDSAVTRKSTCIALGRELLSVSAPHVIGDSLSTSSVEGLLDGLTAQPQVTFIESEMGKLLYGFGQTNYRSAIRVELNDWYDSSTLTRRLSGHEFFIAEPCISVLGGSAPQFLEEYTTAMDWEGGLFSRFDFCLCPDRERFLAWNKTEAGAIMEHRMMLLAELDRIKSEPTLGPCIGFTPEARALWTAWLYANEEQRKGGNAALSGHFVRGQNTAIKAAAIYAISLYLANLDGGPWLLDAQCVALGIAYALLAIKSVMLLTQDMAANPYQRRRRELLRNLQTAGGPGQTRGSVARQLKCSRRDLDEALFGLIDEGRILESASTAGAVYRFVTEEAAVVNELTGNKNGPLMTVQETDAALAAQHATAAAAMAEPAVTQYLRSSNEVGEG